jgi:hypothetical protein
MQEPGGISMLKIAMTALAALLIITPVLADEQTVKASDDSVLKTIMDINTIYNLDDEKNHLLVRIFLRGGGDPAMNGNHLLLAIIPAPGQVPHIWDTGIDIDSVRNIVQDAEKSEVRIKVIEHFQPDQHDTRERQSLYTIRYDLDPATGSIADSIHIRNDVTP